MIRQFLVACLFVLSIVAVCPAQSNQKLLQASQLMRQSKFKQAEQILAEVTKAAPNNFQAWSMLGACQHSQNDFKNAIESYKKTLANQAFKPGALFNIACAQVRLGRTDAAIRSLRKAFEVGFKNVDLMEYDADLLPLKKNETFQTLLAEKRKSEKVFLEKGARIIHRWLGEAAGDEFGWVARIVGDCDGDKVVDFVASAPSHKSGSGKIYVYSGKFAKLLFEVTGEKGERLGNGAASAGDVDNDGIPDVIAGAPNARNGGAAYVFSGKTGKKIHRLTIESQSAAQFGYKVCTIFDVDGDKHDDVFVGAISADGDNKKSGVGFAFSGKTGKQLFKLSGERTGDKFGSAVSATKFGNSILLAVGAQDAGPNKAGRVYVYRIESGKPKLSFKIEPDSTNVNLGQMFVSFPGDVNADGVPDVYVSDFSANDAKTNTRGVGKVYIYSGADGKKIYEISGKQAGEGFGTSPSDARDVNGDGIGDLIIGAWQNRNGARSGGRVTLHNGKDGKLIDSWTCVQAGDTFGFDAVGIGDIDGDGNVDFLLTSGWANIRGSKTGRIFVVAGKDYN